MEAKVQIKIIVNDQEIFNEDLTIENENKDIVCASALTAIVTGLKVAKEKAIAKFESME